MCAVAALPLRENWKGRDSVAIKTEFVRRGAEKQHPACLAQYGSWLLLGVFPGIPKDPDAAKPLLLEAAKQGYYLAVERLFRIRYSRANSNAFDFADEKELSRALCWGRLAHQYTTTSGFNLFLEELRTYAREHNRADLMKESYRLDPKRVPASTQVVTAPQCVKFEKGEDMLQQTFDDREKAALLPERTNP
jgi:hypothetical protein